MPKRKKRPAWKGVPAADAKPKRPDPPPSKCRDCGATDRIPRYEFFKSPPPKCTACGGLMDYGGSFHRTR